MYAAVILAVTVPATMDACHSRQARSCATTQRVVVVRQATCTSCSSAAMAQVAKVSCARVGIVQRHHVNAAARHQRIADRHDVRALNIGLQRGNVIFVAPPKK